jgi:hypothetical protein
MVFAGVSPLQRGNRGDGGGCRGMLPAEVRHRRRGGSVECDLNENSWASAAAAAAAAAANAN